MKLLERYRYGIIAFAALLLLIPAVMFIYSQSGNSDSPIRIEGMSDEEVAEAVNREVEEGKINVQYSLYAVFDGKKSESFMVRNIEKNHHPLEFTIYDEDGNSIYSSMPINLGYELKDITLDRELPRGDHDCSIRISYVAEGNVASVFPLKVKVV